MADNLDNETESYSDDLKGLRKSLRKSRLESIDDLKGLQFKCLVQKDT